VDKNMKTALLVIATGEKYAWYADRLIESADAHMFPHDTILFTDNAPILNREWAFSRVGTKLIRIPVEPKGFPNETLMRYHTFLSVENILKEYDNLFYVDSDMLFVAPVKEEEILSNGITATLHPGYIGQIGTPERRPESKAYIPAHAMNKYFCGGFNGGRADTFLWMARHIKAHIDEDTANSITAVWHDESHLNAFLYYNCPPARILTPSFCWPEGCQGKYDSWTESYEPKLVALTKKDSHV
jgi:hypothetical protein